VFDTGVIYVPNLANPFPTPVAVLYAFDASATTNCSGTPKVCTPLWSASMTNNDTYVSSPTVANGAVLVGTDNGLYAYDASGNTHCSGMPKVCDPVWVQAPFGRITTPAVANGVVYAGSAFTLDAFDATTGAPLWTASSSTTSPPTVANGAVYIVVGSGSSLEAFDASGVTNCSGAPKTCSPLWTATNGGQYSFSDPAVANGAVYISATDQFTGSSDQRQGLCMGAAVGALPRTAPTRLTAHAAVDDSSSRTPAVIDQRANAMMIRGRSHRYASVERSETAPGGCMAEQQSPQQMGHGVKQRDLVVMSHDEVDAFLHERRPMTMCTLNHDGSIHAVAMWYGFLEGSIAVETKAKSQKAMNLRRDPRMTCMFEDGDYYEELRGIELVGTAEIIDDPERMWELGVNLFERYNGTYTEEMRPMVEMMLNKRIVAKLNVERTVSWDHRKLGLPTTRPT
jgi:PPOX class probable F420-dependent enzyme